MPEKPIAELIRIYQMAERAGFKYGWTADEAPSSPFRDPYAVLAALGYQTQTLKIGTAIHVPYTRHPALLAYAIASYDELFPGRMTLGLGAGGVLTLNPLGIKMWDRPLLAIREAVQICRQLFQGEQVTFEGKIFQLYDTKLYQKPSHPIPIYLAARGPKMLQLAGEIADGALCSLPLATVAWAIAQINKGIKKAGRTLEDFQLVNSALLSVDTDDKRARDAVRRELGAGVVFADSNTHTLTGVNLQDVKRLKDAAGDSWVVPPELVTDEMIDIYSVTGTPDEVIEKLALYEKKGIKVTNFDTPSGPDIDKAFQMIRNKILPALSH